MQSNNAPKTLLLAALLVVLGIAAWEGYWRLQGFTPTYNDDKALWALKRKEVYGAPERTTIFIGSSRIKFDLDIPTWEKLTGEKAVQLALVGTSPVLLLKDLAEDENFKGKVVIDVTEPLFFSPAPRVHESAKEAIEFYKKQTPSETISEAVSLGLESKLAFLEEGRFSLNQLLQELPLKNRPGVKAPPIFPKTFEWTRKNRQTYMPELFLSNPAHIKQQTDVWMALVMANPAPPISGQPLQAVLNQIKGHVQAIKNRGGKVLFVRTPSSGPFLDGEDKAFPRKNYWEALLQTSQTEGIHFRDEPRTAQYVCPEWSHLSPTQAVDYTQVFIGQLQQKGWFH